MSKYLAFSTIQIMDSELILYLFYDKDFPLILPPPYNEVEPEGNCACLQACDDMAELNDELALTGRMLKQVQGQGLSLSVYRRENKARADDSAVRLSQDLLQQMNTCKFGLDYSYYAYHERNTRYSQVMSFFLITFPGGEVDAGLPPNIPWLFGDKYRGQRFVMTPDITALADWLSYLAKQAITCPELRIDYFSEGSMVIWYMSAEDEIRSLDALSCNVELRIHPAMLLPEDDAIAPLFRYLMRSSVWRECLQPPCEGNDEILFS